MRLGRKEKTALIYLALLALLFALAYFWYNYQKYHPMLVGEVKVERGMLVVSSPVDVIIVVNGNIIGPTRHFEMQLNNSVLLELWYGVDKVYRYLIYRDTDGQYRVIWQYYRS